MKTLITTMILLFTIITYSQSKQFIRNYDQIQFIESNGAKSEWYKTETRFFYYYTHQKQIKIYVNNQVKLFHFDDVIQETTNDINYTIFHCLEYDTCEEVFICLFNNIEQGCIIIFLNKEMIYFK